jgi:hypothetical protein
LSRNSTCHVTMEMLQTHCYTTGTITLLWKRHQRLDMSQYHYYCFTSESHETTQVYLDEF